MGFDPSQPTGDHLLRKTTSLSMSLGVSTLSSTGNGFPVAPYVKNPQRHSKMGSARCRDARARRFQNWKSCKPKTGTASKTRSDIVKMLTAMSMSASATLPELKVEQADNRIRIKNPQRHSKKAHRDVDERERDASETESRASRQPESHRKPAAT